MFTDNPNSIAYHDNDLDIELFKSNENNAIAIQINNEKYYHSLIWELDYMYSGKNLSQLDMCDTIKLKVFDNLLCSNFY